MYNRNFNSDLDHEVCFNFHDTHNDISVPSYDNYSDVSLNVDIPQISYAFNSNLFIDKKAIPRNIVYIGENDMNEEYEEEDPLYDILPHWNCLKFTPKQQYKFISLHFPDHINKYRKLKNKLFKRRYFICLYLYIKGGVYIDNKYKLKTSFESLFEKDADIYFLTIDDNNQCNKNVRISWDFFACRPHCEFWLSLLSIIDTTSDHTNIDFMISNHINPYTYDIGSLETFLSYTGSPSWVKKISKKLFSLDSDSSLSTLSTTTLNVIDRMTSTKTDSYILTFLIFCILILIVLIILLN